MHDKREVTERRDAMEEFGYRNIAELEVHSEKHHFSPSALPTR
jgi:hypothetical protein